MMERIGRLEGSVSRAGHVEGAGLGSGKTVPSTRQSIEDLINSGALSAFQIRTVLLALILVVVDGYDNFVVAVALPSIAAEWKVEVASMGVVLSAAAFGLSISTLFMAPVSDALGRRVLLLFGATVLGASMISTLLTHTILELVLVRIATGVGVAACLNSAFALISDYVPLRRKAVFMALYGCSISLGAALGGVVAPWLISHFQWRSLFVVGGLLPVVLIAPLYFWAPESLQILLTKKPHPRNRERIHGILRRMGISAAVEGLYSRKPHGTPKNSVRAILSRPYWRLTLLLWCVFTINSFSLYMLSGWLPTLLKLAQLPEAVALRSSSSMWFGSMVGSLAISWLIDRGKLRLAIVGALVIGAAAFGLFGLVPRSPLFWNPILFVGGAMLGGMQFVIAGLCARIYPSSILATGAGWAGSISRIGAITGPLAGGWMVGAHVSPVSIVCLLGIPMLVCAAVFGALFAFWPNPAPAGRAA
jgi:MFS transporter, AAHS family, 4-hydroxybenzoate transporter